MEAFICDAVRTPIGRYSGKLSQVRTDDLGAIPISALMRRNPSVDWDLLEDVWYGCANQAGEDNRNVARMCSLLAGLPESVGGVTINRLCGSGMDAVGSAARAIKAGEMELAMAGGVESMSRAPFVLSKSTSPFDRNIQTYDTTIGWRFINPVFQSTWGTDSMPQTAENVSEEFSISREDQDHFALRSHNRAVAAQDAGFFEKEITEVTIAQRKQDPIIVDTDEGPRRSSSLEALAKLPAPFRDGGTVTAGNASTVNDGACSLLLASEKMAISQGLTPRARILSMAATGLQPRIMGFGPFEASKKALALAGLNLDQIDVFELNEAFAAQTLAVTRALRLSDDAENVNPNGGAIALGHPLGMSGARLITTAVNELERRHARLALCTMCVGVGQGIALIIERV